MLNLVRSLAILCACAPFVITSALATSYPAKPIRMIVAFAPGGSADINARIVGRQLGKELGQAVVIENKGGAGGNIGATEAKRAAPDGYTIFYATSAVVLAPAVYAKPGFDPYKDFTPISLTATIPLVLVASPTVPAKTVSEFIAWGKTQAGKLNYGSSGSGALLHLAAALFLKETGLEATHVPYKGSAPAINDILGGSTQFMFLPVNEALPHLEGGKLRALAVTHDKRLPQLPDVSTIREATGLATLDTGAWQGLMVPNGTPAEVVGKLNTALQKVLKDEETQNLLMKQGSIVLGGTDKEYSEFMKAEGERWARVVRETGAKAD
jgi:tripartite-type tricarboxylate transporter receptor subunit TctC